MTVGARFLSIMLLLSMGSGTLLASPSCHIIEYEQVESVAREQVKMRLEEYPALYRHILKVFEHRIFRSVMEACLAGGCRDQTDVFRHVHVALERHMRPLRWSTGAILIFSTSASAYLTTLIQMEGPVSAAAKLGVGFVTLSSAAALAYWHAPLQASITRMSYNLLGPRLQPGSDGFIDASPGSRSFGSKEHALYRLIGIRWNATMDSLALNGWFRFSSFVGSAGNARGTIKDIADTFKAPTQDTLEFLAHRVARFMVDARGLPGAIPFDNPQVMSELKMTLWPVIYEQQALLPAFTYMVKKSLEYWDPYYKMDVPDSSASLYYNSFLRAWKVDGVEVPQQKITIRPPRGVFEAFDRLGKEQSSRDRSKPEETNLEIARELEKYQQALELDKQQAQLESDSNSTPPTEVTPPPASPPTPTPPE